MRHVARMSSTGGAGTARELVDGRSWRDRCHQGPTWCSGTMGGVFPRMRPRRLVHRRPHPGLCPQADGRRMRTAALRGEGRIEAVAEAARMSVTSSSGGIVMVNVERRVKRLGAGFHVPPRSDEGMATAEYAIATLAACGFAGLLVALMRSDEVRGLLYSVIQRALSLA